MRCLGLLLVLFCAACALPVKGDDKVCWQAQAETGRLEFTALYAGQPMTGYFTEFKVEVACEQASRTPIALRVDVAVGSADMNDAEANAELREPDWFYTRAFPQAIYQADELHSTESGFAAVGSLRIKGVAQPLALSFDWKPGGDGILMSGVVELSRRAWQVGTGEWAQDTDLADNVTVRYRVTLYAVE